MRPLTTHSIHITFDLSIFHFLSHFFSFFTLFFHALIAQYNIWIFLLFLITHLYCYLDLSICHFMRPLTTHSIHITFDYSVDTSNIYIYIYIFFLTPPPFFSRFLRTFVTSYLGGSFCYLLLLTCTVMQILLFFIVTQSPYFIYSIYTYSHKLVIRYI